MTFYYAVTTADDILAVERTGVLDAKNAISAYKLFREKFPRYCFNHEYKLFVFDSYEAFVLYVSNNNLQWATGNNIIDL